MASDAASSRIAAAAALTADDIHSVRRGDPSVGPALDVEKILNYIRKSAAGEQHGTETSATPTAPITPEERDTGLVLFNNRTCPFGQRAWWSLFEKTVDPSEYKYVHINLGPTKPEWYKETVNPSGTVPCFYDNGKPVFESSTAVEFAEEKFAGRGNALMPADLTERAAVRNFIKRFNEGIPKYYRVLMNKDPAADEEKIAEMRQEVAEINALYEKQSAGPYFLGEEFSAADLNAITFFARFNVLLPFYRGVVPFPEGDPSSARLLAALQAGSKRPGFIATFPEPEYFGAVYWSYAGGSLER